VKKPPRLIKPRLIKKFVQRAQREIKLIGQNMQDMSQMLARARQIDNGQDL
jgi:CO dehydrogenase/acetyl-CoA synthase epsilon subunit